jgi:hypothetical protein
MAKILKTFKKDAVKNFITSVSNGDIRAYVFASGVSSVSNTVNENYDESVFRVQREMMFGRQISTAGAYDSISANNLAFLTRRIDWANNTIFNYYDNTNSNLFEANTQFYVVSHSTLYDTDKDVYKCIWNNNDGRSTIDPSVALSGTPIGGKFTTSDGYVWLYMYTIQYGDWNKFGFNSYMPVFTNSTSSSSATDGIPFITVDNPGSGYTTKTGNIIAVSTNTTFQIGTVSTVSSTLNQYANSFLYITVDPSNYNSNTYLSRITTSYSNSITGYVYATITPGIPSVTEIQANYSTFAIGPYVDIKGDGAGATAFANVSSTGSINYITLKTAGSGYTRANVTILNQTTTGSGATAHALIAPPGGHGYDPFQELGASALGIYMKFANTDTNMTANLTYNTVGMLANPKIKGNNTVLFSNASFSQLMTINLSSNAAFTVNELINTSNNKSIYYLRTASTPNSIYAVGDRTLSNNETLTGTLSAQTNIISGIASSNGDLNAFRSEILYINNLNANGITRTTSSNEEIKLAIQF